MIRDKRGQAAPKPGVRMALSAAAAVVLAAFALAPTGALAEDSVAWGQKIWQDKAGCNFCHGWAGDGDGGFHHPGHAPSLRTTELTRDQIRETIQCGRPGTAMPHFDRFAYTDKRCYGMTAADLGDQMPDRSQVTLQRDEIDALADYVATKIKGLGKVTQQQCYDYYGPGTATCDIYAPKTQ
jgi:mono/diheme cytochrome c family protein